MDAQTLRESVTDSIHYWEPRRLVYNAALAAVVLVYLGIHYHTFKRGISVDVVLFLFLLAVLANVAYCAAYLVDIFGQVSGYREQWRRYRWVVFIVGTLFAGIITRFFAMGMFLSGPTGGP